MTKLSVTFITIGLLFLVGLLADLIGRHTAVPRVTLLLVMGFLVGPGAMNVLPEASHAWFPTISSVALMMVGFLLGGKITLEFSQKYGRLVLWLSLAEVGVTAAMVFVALLLIGTPLTVALLLAGIAPATAPAATADVIRQYEADGPFTQTLAGIVTIDDAWGLVLFSVLLAVAQGLEGQADPLAQLGSGLWEVAGALTLGFVVGVPMAYISGRIEPGEPTLAEALGMVLLVGGLAFWLDVSFLLASMALGCTVSNSAGHHRRPFHAIEGIEWPFMILFFVLAGAAVEAGEITRVGLLGLTYIIARAGGRLVGAWAGGALGGAPSFMRRWMGLALMPQAGVAVGMALLAAQRFPEHSSTIFAVIIGATVVFELVGPVLTKIALVRAGEIRSA